MFLPIRLLVAFPQNMSSTSKKANNMKLTITFISCFIGIQLFACCNKSSEMTSRPDNALTTDSMKLKITVGTNTFTATLYNNATVTEFKKKLPMTINMQELNGNEKYFDLPDNLPPNASNPGTIQTGGSKEIV